MSPYMNTSRLPVRDRQMMISSLFDFGHIATEAIKVHGERVKKCLFHDSRTITDNYWPVSEVWVVLRACMPPHHCHVTVYALQRVIVLSS